MKLEPRRSPLFILQAIKAGDKAGDEASNIPRAPDVTPPTNVSRPQTLARSHSHSSTSGNERDLGTRLVRLIVQEKRRIQYISCTPRNRGEELVL